VRNGICLLCTLTYIFLVLAGVGITQIPELITISKGQFEMGDHHDLGGAEHRNDEVPVHLVSIDSFKLGKTEITNQQYGEYLNSAYAYGWIEVKDGYVYAAGGTEIYCETDQAVDYSGIHWDDSQFSVHENKENHPMVGVRWFGAAAYCNWLSAEFGYEKCYDLTTGVCDFNKQGFRLPTEAEWEYAGRGQLYTPYAIYPWGDDPDITRANWPNSGDPFETGPYPWTTPAGFYNGELHQKTDFNWPGDQASYQTSDGANGFGLYDMAGNVWEWCNDWYTSDYYENSSTNNPTGPDSGKLMPDGQPYRVLRSGNWYNGKRTIQTVEIHDGHSRVSNRNPSYYRGPDDPNHAWYHIGFRVALKADEWNLGLIAPGATLQELANVFSFTEGPAADEAGNVYFTDIQNNRIHIWSVDNQLSTFRENSGGANGLFFDRYGNLLVCEGDNGRVVSIDGQYNVTVLADIYDGKPFNKPNDLWIDPKGGVYFSDPIYGNATQNQDGEHVYYLVPDQNQVLRVIDDMVRPNGLIGTPDGQTLYVADHGAGQIYQYHINPNGTLSDKAVFVNKGSDGMTIDELGNIYLTSGDVWIYNVNGELIEKIDIPQNPTNVCFGGSDRQKLFITAQKSLYAIDMRVKGISQFPSTSIQASAIYEIPTTLALEQNYPNPFNPETVIRYKLYSSSDVRLVIYNITGQLIKTLVNDYQSAGSYEVGWNGHDHAGNSVSSGIYLYRLNAGHHVLTRKMSIIR